MTEAFSSIAGMMIMNMLVVESQKEALKQGVTPLIFSSQNVDGFDNDCVYQHFGPRLGYEPAQNSNTAHTLMK
ncbi:hypothetical protein [Vibrio campbellii]|uniref:hypothetical protein n=1 Tax=Vibrio campbellii TaxID=680 RepID=UPI00210B8A32|nr:hypothetical protein [Vibrio campbellii]